MKQIIFVLYLMFPFNVFCQKLIYSGIDTIDKRNKYKYEYWFRFDNVDDTSSYVMDKKVGVDTSLIFLTDHLGVRVVFASITIKNLVTGTITELRSNFDGWVSEKLKPGHYLLNVDFFKSDPFALRFSLGNNEQLYLKVRLGLAPELTIYQINSKKKLPKAKVQSIMKCVKEHRNDDIGKCRKRKQYYISIQI